MWGGSLVTKIAFAKGEWVFRKYTKVLYSESITDTRIRLERLRANWRKLPDIQTLLREILVILEDALIYWLIILFFHCISSSALNENRYFLFFNENWSLLGFISVCISAINNPLKNRSIHLTYKIKVSLEFFRLLIIKLTL